MIDTVVLCMNLIAGLAIGTFYFFGLWWTIRRLPAMKAPSLWALVSFLVRSGVALAGFYVSTQGRWPNLLMCLAGFTLMRLWLVRRLKPAAVQVRSDR